MRVWRIVSVAFLVAFAVAATSTAAVYRVGPGEEYALISEVAGKLQPGDVVEVTGDISDSVVLTRHGTHARPITVRGATRSEEGRIIRPKISSGEKRFVLRCTADWVVIEGLEFDGLEQANPKGSTGLKYQSDNLVVRNCYFHQLGAAVTDSPDAGNAAFEFCEFESNNHGINVFQISAESSPNVQLTVEHCYFHNSTGFRQLCSRYPRNVIRYNWFESPYQCCLNILGAEGGTSKVEMEPMHVDIIGNVFFMGWSPGSRYSVMRIGGEQADAPGTEGDFNIAHNLLVTTKLGAPRDEAAFVLVGGNVEKVIFYNNVFLEYGVAGGQVYYRGKTYDSVRTRAFVERRGSPDPIVEGANNWISTRALDGTIPEGLQDTIRGFNPLFADLVNFDFRPRKDSPLVGAGLFPLPRGQIVDLTPEFEPQRGIPTDLKPKPRRKATPPSIGPFEVAE